MAFILVIVYNSIQFIDQYKEENIFIKGIVSAKKGLNVSKPQSNFSCGSQEN